jgi:prepilin-type processing-associated H-X9-DG protein
MNRYGKTWVNVATLLALCLIFFSLFMVPPGGGRAKHNKWRTECQSNLKKIGMSVMQYLQDNNDRFPLAFNSKGGNWNDALQPYLKESALFQCAAADSFVGGTTDYFYNSKLAKIEYHTLKVDSSTILLGDGTDNSLLGYSRSNMPKEWLQGEASPVRRHLDRGNYLFTDGHVKNLSPGSVKHVAPVEKEATFAVR